MTSKTETTPRRTKTVRTVKRFKRVVSIVPTMKKIIQCEKPYIHFGGAIREARHKLGWTQLDLAQKLNLSRGSIANIEVGRQRIMLDDVFQFANVLGLDPKKLFERTCRE